MDISGNKWTATMGNNRSPEKQGKVSRWHNDGFEGEEVSETVHWEHRDSSLHHPIQKHHQKRTTCDVGTGGKRIRKVFVRWPDGSNHVLKISTTLNRCDCCPLIIN